MPVFSIRRAAGPLLGSLIMLSNCTEQEQPRQPVAAVAVPATAPATPPSAAPTASRPDTTEYLDWATARINGRLPLQGPASAAWQVLGRPDSVVVPNPDNECSSFFGRAHREAYAGATEVELYGDTAVVRSLDMRRLALHAGPLRLTHQTTLAELGKTFPRAVREQSALNDSELGEVTAVNLRIAAQPTDDSWLLLFKNGKLARIDYFVPC